MSKQGNLIINYYFPIDAFRRCGIPRLIVRQGQYRSRVQISLHRISTNLFPSSNIEYFLIRISFYRQLHPPPLFLPLLLFLLVDVFFLEFLRRLPPTRSFALTSDLYTELEEIVANIPTPPPSNIPFSFLIGSLLVTTASQVVSTFPPLFYQRLARFVSFTLIYLFFHPHLFPFLFPRHS